MAVFPNAASGARAAVPQGHKRRARASVWLEVLRTANAPEGQLDRVSTWLVVTRAAVLPMTLTAGAVAGLLAVRAPSFDAVDFALALCGILLAHVANNLMNDLFDAAVGSDTATYPRALYAPHPVLSGIVSRRALVVATLGVNAADLAIMVVLLAARGWPIAAFAVAGFVLSVAYTAPPLRLKQRGLGEADVAVVWGPLMVGGTYFAAVGRLPWQVVVASLPYALACTAVLMGKHIDKAPYDARLGIRTLPVLLGERRARLATRATMAGFYVLVVAGVVAGALPWPALVALGGIPSLARVWGPFGKPKPEAPPLRFPVWPLWFAALAFVHTRRAGALLLLGLAVAAAAGIHPGL